MKGFSRPGGSSLHTASPVTTKRTSHIKELDGLRGIAVLSILVLHFYDLSGTSSRPYGSLIAKIMPVLAGGVDLFFVLSGFLITRILLATKESSNYFRAFYMRRVLRIFPLYFFVLLFFFIVALPVAHKHGLDTKLTWRQAGWYLIFAQNWMQAFRINDGAQLAHLWTLAIEEQFYLVWPAAVLLLSAKVLKRSAVIICVSAFFLRFFFLRYSIDLTFVYFNTLSRLDTLLLGSLFALSPDIARLFALYAPAAMPLAFLLAVLSPPSLMPNALLIICGSAVALAAFERGSLLRSRLLRTIGKYSFAIYVFHYLIHGVLAPVAHKFKPFIFTSAAIVFGSGLSFIMALASWNLIEEPFLRLKNYFNYMSSPIRLDPALPFSGSAKKTDVDDV